MIFAIQVVDEAICLYRTLIGKPDIRCVICAALILKNITAARPDKPQIIINARCVKLHSPTYRRLFHKLLPCRGDLRHQICIVEQCRRLYGKRRRISFPVHIARLNRRIRKIAVCIQTFRHLCSKRSIDIVGKLIVRDPNDCIRSRIAFYGLCKLLYGRRLMNDLDLIAVCRPPFVSVLLNRIRLNAHICPNGKFCIRFSALSTTA